MKLPSSCTNLSSLSHDLRTPLTGILGIVTLLNREALTPTQLDYVEDIRKTGEKLLGEIERLVTLLHETQAALPKLLLVEDNLLIQQIHSAILKELGYEVDVAGTGHEALALWEKHCYNGVLLDLGLPDIDGTEVAKEIRRREMLSNRSPIIAITGFAQAEVESACLAVGIDKVLNKPVEANQLGNILQQYLQCSVNRP